ncbi:MAG: hypothetical protein ACRCZS_23015 [Chroococcidiopsis sp.]
MAIVFGRIVFHKGRNLTSTSIRIPQAFILFAIALPTVPGMVQLGGFWMKIVSDGVNLPLLHFLPLAA